MSKIVVTRSGNQVTGVYLSQDLPGIADLEFLDYDTDLSPEDEKLEAEIDNGTLINIL